jgi:hypothetical protein
MTTEEIIYYIETVTDNDTLEEIVNAVIQKGLNTNLILFMGQVYCKSDLEEEILGKTISEDEWKDFVEYVNKQRPFVDREEELSKLWGKYK